MRLFLKLSGSLLNVMYFLMSEFGRRDHLDRHKRLKDHVNPDGSPYEMETPPKKPKLED